MRSSPPTRWKIVLELAAEQRRRARTEGALGQHRSEERRRPHEADAADHCEDDDEDRLEDLERREEHDGGATEGDQDPTDRGEARPPSPNA